jgi:hypothetical protein
MCSGGHSAAKAVIIVFSLTAIFNLERKGKPGHYPLMRVAGIVLAALAVVGCHRAPAPQAEAPALDTPGEEQLEALIIDERPTTVATEFGECPFEPSEVPPLTAFDDSRIPEFDAGRSRASNMNSGEGRLDDVQLYERMMPLQDEVFRCLDIAACYTQESIGTGELDFQFELASNGRVRSATVRPSEELDVGPVVSCARMALARMEFPAYDGGNMHVSYQLSIE